MMLFRTLIVASTIGVLINLLFDRPAPSRMIQVDYCLVDVYAATKTDEGQWVKFWAEGYRPCSQLDRYENT